MARTDNKFRWAYLDVPILRMAPMTLGVLRGSRWLGVCRVGRRGGDRILLLVLRLGRRVWQSLKRLSSPIESGIVEVFAGW